MANEKIIHCKDCAWFAPLESNPAAVRLHKILTDTLGTILEKRPGECGVCRKVTFNADRPVFTNSEGFCHRAERKTD